MRSRAVPAAAIALLAGAFVVDVFTPQTLVVAILLDVPIVLAALTQRRRLTFTLVAIALAADAGAALIDAARDGYRWDPIGIGDRLLSMLSIVLVGYLSTAVQERAARVERLAAQARLFTALAERNAALAERQDVIRDLVYAISHDLRTPLTALAMTLRQAAEGAYGPLPERYTGVLRESVISVEDLSRLAETLLLVARFESGDRRTERERVDLAAIAREIASEFGAMADARGVALTAHANGSVATIASRADVKRAVANLVSNALQHTPRGGTVDVRVGADADSAELRVDDDGVGIDPRARASLFQRFSRASRGGGTGLGLYLVKRIAEDAGGSVRYEPREPHGSAFVLRLPSAAP